MKNKLESLLGTAGHAVGAAAKGAGDIVEMGCNKAQELALRTRLARLQRQLGALVYALHKNGEGGAGMQQWYIAQMDTIQEKIAAVCAGQKQEPRQGHSCCCEGEGENDAMFCTCGCK